MPSRRCDERVRSWRLLSVSRPTVRAARDGAYQVEPSIRAVGRIARGDCAGTCGCRAAAGVVARVAARDVVRRTVEVHGAAAAIAETVVVEPPVAGPRA